MNKVENYIWLGAAYYDHRIMVLGESAYNCTEDDPAGMHSYIKTGRDWTFMKILNALTGLRGLNLGPKLEQERREFWDNFLLLNFIVSSLGQVNRRPKVSEWCDPANIAMLRSVLERYLPAAVWIWGNSKNHCTAYYAKAVVEALGFRHIVSMHPSRASYAYIKSEFERLGGLRK